MPGCGKLRQLSRNKTANRLLKKLKKGDGHRTAVVFRGGCVSEFGASSLFNGLLNSQGKMPWRHGGSRATTEYITSYISLSGRSPLVFRVLSVAGYLLRKFFPDRALYPLRPRK
jgi:hypothetical protein